MTYVGSCERPQFANGVMLHRTIGSIFALALLLHCILKDSTTRLHRQRRLALNFPPDLRLEELDKAYNTSATR